jgi:hypothetical protein
MNVKVVFTKNYILCIFEQLYWREIFIIKTTQRSFFYMRRDSFVANNDLRKPFHCLNDIAYRD